MTNKNISLQSLKNDVDKLTLRLSAFETSVARINSMLSSTQVESENVAFLCQTPVGLTNVISFYEASNVNPTISEIQEFSCNMFPNFVTNNQSYLYYNKDDDTLRYSMFLKVIRDNLTIFCEGHNFPELLNNKLELFILTNESTTGNQWKKVFEISNGVVDRIIKETIIMSNPSYVIDSAGFKWKSLFDHTIGKINQMNLLYCINTHTELNNLDIEVTTISHTLLPIVKFTPLYSTTMFGSVGNNL
jgi:hypothetical protein